VTARRTIRVVAAVIEQDGKILVSLRHPKGERPAQWEFPGGKIEKGENEQEALVRELQEELGVTSEVGPLLRRMVHHYSDADVDLCFHAARIIEGEPQPLSMAELRWVPRAELSKLDFLEADRLFVAELAGAGGD